MGLLPKMVIKKWTFRGKEFELTWNFLINEGIRFGLLYLIYVTSLSAVFECKAENVAVINKYNACMYQNSAKTNSTIKIPSNVSEYPFWVR